MKRILSWLFCIAMGLLHGHVALAHEPLFGIGPHVLFKGGYAPHVTFSWGESFSESEYALGYGITKDWTAIAEIPFAHRGEEPGYEGFHLKQKYRFFSRFTPGVSKQISAVSKVVFPARENDPTVVNLGVTGGQEALKWYWFFSGNYGARFGDESIQPGNDLTYTATIGYRPMRTTYYKPDIVLFLEGIGRYQGESRTDGETMADTGGSQWSIAPTFMFTYRNVALRGGARFGVGSDGGLPTPENSFRAILEYHF